MKQRRKNIEIGKQAVLKEQFELNKRQMYYISKKHETEQEFLGNIKNKSKIVEFEDQI